MFIVPVMARALLLASAAMVSVVAIVLTFGVPAHAASGGIAHSDQASARFHSVDECAYTEMLVSFTAGKVQTSGSGASGQSPFADVVVEMQIFDACSSADPSPLISSYYGATVDIPADITPLNSARVDHIAVDISDGVDTIPVAVDLTWTGNGDPASRITHDSDYRRNERFVTAAATGTVDVDGTVFDSAYSAEIAHVVEMNVPGAGL
jgi:hypothetical protein